MPDVPAPIAPQFPESRLPHSHPGAGRPVAPGSPSRPPRGTLRGVLLFAACTIGGLWLARGGGSWRDIASTLGGAAPRWLVLGLAQAGLDAALGGARMWFCARAIGGRVSIWSCMAANTANVFLGGVTPSQSGGGPAQIFLLMRGGLTFAEATVASTSTFLGTVVVFLGIAVHAAQQSSPVTHPALAAARVATMVVFAACALGCLLALPRPERASRWVRGLLARLGAPGRRIAASRAGRGLDAWLADMHVLLRRALRDGAGWLVASVGLSALIYVNKFAIGWTAARAVGLEPPVAAMLHRHELQALVTYFAPTPGAAGLAELSAAALLADLVPQSHRGAYLVVWRACSLYAEMCAGAAVLVWAAMARPRRRTSC